MSDNEAVDECIADATFDFTMGDNATAITKLEALVAREPAAAAAWHSLSEILLADRRLDDALRAAERAVSLNPEDVHINVSLSRIWVELGDKERAEHFGAQARMFGWKATLRGDVEAD